jgi:hypothetical protein
LRPAPRKNGIASDRPCIAKPVSAGLTDWARVRLILVIEAACSRSWSRTASIRKVWRVGTSICERRCRAKRSAIASDATGDRATPIKSTLEIRWEKTMVLTSPSRGAARAASRSESPERIWTPKKIQPSVSRPRPKRV